MWFRTSALVTGLVAAVVVLIVVYILNLISPAPAGGFGWALGVSVVNAFFAGYFGHIAGLRDRVR